MATENWDRVDEGLDILLTPLVVYLVRQLADVYGEDRWWEDGVEPALTQDQKRDCEGLAGDKAHIGAIDMAMALGILDRQWNDVFRRRLPRDCRTWAIELKGVRNKEAHKGVYDCSDDDAYRYLDTMERLCSEIDPGAADQIRALMNEVRYGNAEGSAGAAATGAGSKARKGATSALGVKDLPSWRDVVEPHPDVAAGRYRKAEFAADLAQVARGTAEPEYQDPYEFFSRTYMTTGMKGLLVQSLERVGGRGGEPVIQLKTAFGGGKTHSMLALYHMLKSRVDVDRAPVLKEVLDEAGLTEVPEVRVAVIVGTALNPAQGTRPADLPGSTVNTLWGEIAHQLAVAAGRPELYDIVKEADKKGTSPGSAALTQLFDECGPCLVLIDELVAYAKKLYGAEGLPAGTFDNLITFIQELTEAARASRNSLVVASIPESEREIGGEAGKEALAAIEHTFGRMESVWKPVTADEGFAVVSRRLFSANVDEAKRDQVCEAYLEMYRQSAGDFPVEAHEGAYLERLRSCYPIHPEVYERLYEDWATIDGFQRTRGVLRFMAAVIHELWVEGDAAPIINVGSLPLDEPAVRDELTRYLGDAWNTVVEAEVDGRNSEPMAQDKEKSYYGKAFASRRVARTVFMGSAPDTSSQTARGIDIRQVNLGVAQPGETLAVFHDALVGLRGRCSYLYADGRGERFWYDTRPNLRRTVEGRAQGMRDAQADAELEGRIKKWRKPAGLAGLHTCPASSLDVPDECGGARLVVLGLDAPHKRNDDGSAACTAARDILANRGNGPRKYRNALVFLAADSGKLAELRDEAKHLLAWKSVLAEADRLDLTKSAIKEAEASIQSYDERVDAKLADAYQWVLYPTVDPEFGGFEEEWQDVKLGSSGDTVPERCVGTLRGEGALITGAWSPMLLARELGRWYWKNDDCKQVDALWDDLNRYCYLPRLSGREVLDGAILEGARSSEFFGIAAGVEGEGEERRFVDLHLGEPRSFVHGSDLLVKVDAAQAQLEAEEAARRAEEERRAAAAGAAAAGGSGGASGSGAATAGGYGSVAAAGGAGSWSQSGAVASAAGTGAGSAPGAAQAAAAPRPHSFGLSCEIDRVHANKQIQQLLEEVVDQLARADDADITITLEVSAYSESGFDASVKRTVGANCDTLGLSDAGFGEVR